MILLLLPAVMWLFFNTAVNRHIHILSDGFVISHSHPFANKLSDSSPLQTHQHTEKELLLLGIFSAVVFSFITLLILRSYLQIYPQKFKIRLIHREPVRKYFQVHHYHAPPLPC